MLNTLFMIFEVLVLIVGIMIFGGFIVKTIISLVTAPYRKKKQKENVEKLMKELDKIAQECFDELKKEAEKKKKTTKKSTNTKKNTKKTKEN